MAGEIEGPGRWGGGPIVEDPEESIQGPFPEFQIVPVLKTQNPPLDQVASTYWVELPPYCPPLFGAPLGKQRIWEGCTPLSHSLT